MKNIANNSGTSSGWGSFAKSALLSAQKRIDTVLDIRGEHDDDESHSTIIHNENTIVERFDTTIDNRGASTSALDSVVNSQDADNRRHSSSTASFSSLLNQRESNDDGSKSTGSFFNVLGGGLSSLTASLSTKAVDKQSTHHPELLTSWLIGGRSNSETSSKLQVKQFFCFSFSFRF